MQWRGAYLDIGLAAAIEAFFSRLAVSLSDNSVHLFPGQSTGHNLQLNHVGVGRGRGMGTRHDRDKQNLYSMEPRQHITTYAHVYYYTCV